MYLCNIKLDNMEYTYILHGNKEAMQVYSFFGAKALRGEDSFELIAVQSGREIPTVDHWEFSMEVTFEDFATLYASVPYLVTILS